MEINIIRPEEHPYLQIVTSIAKQPETLYWQGGLPPHRQISVAIVGSRKPTPYGRKVTFDLAYKLAQSGIIVISGLAYGIDAEAHRGALEAGGVTLAIMAHGLDKIYPAAHYRLAERILEKGALISEYEAGVSAKPYMFLARNRLISALADAIIVTEAGERSGTLATVMYALEQGKEVFAVPGPITSPLSIGPNRLIQQGAYPITSAEDVLAVIAPDKLQAASEPADDDHGILGHIKSGASTVDSLINATGLEARELLSILTSLELGGKIRNSAGEWVATD